MSRQIYNPYLPSFEYVPDGEPHVFGNRVYIFGSHDRFDGVEFCLNDYVAWSASVDDVTDWKYEGVIYSKYDDPANHNIPPDTKLNKPMFGCRAKKFPENSQNPAGVHAFWAPDVVQGHDGRYYLYYCLDYLKKIGVAVCDTPAGHYTFVDYVRHKDGAILGERTGDHVQFDPGLFIDDDGTIYLYSGNLDMSELQRKASLKNGEDKMSQVMTLEDDMVTLKTEPVEFMPSISQSQGTGFEGHEFFEASSIRKIGSKYYFVYSSVNSHELCYATSDRPDRDYVYGGTVVDIGDIYLENPKQQSDNSIGDVLKGMRSKNALGNTHGGIECVKDQWYVFYHRQTNQTNFSRQACCEKIYINEDGTIDQAEVTSCGLNPGPLEGHGTYPAYIACQCNRNGKSMMSHPLTMMGRFPYFTQDLPDMEPTDENIDEDKRIPVQYVTNLKKGSELGYKYFEFKGSSLKSLRLRGHGKGSIGVYAAFGNNKKCVGMVPVNIKSDDWIDVECRVELLDGVFELIFEFKTGGVLQMQSFKLS